MNTSLSLSQPIRTRNNLMTNAQAARKPAFGQQSDNQSDAIKAYRRKQFAARIGSEAVLGAGVGLLMGVIGGKRIPAIDKAGNAVVSRVKYTGGELLKEAGRGAAWCVGLSEAFNGLVGLFSKRN